MRYRSVLLLVAAAVTVHAAPSARPAIKPSGVVNAASLLPPGVPGGGIAPGSVFLIRGSGLGPAEPVEASASSPREELAGVTVRVVQDGNAWTALLFRAGFGEIRALMPEEARPGGARLVVAYQGCESRPVSIRIAASAFGIFTLAGDGMGPVADSPVRRGELVTITGAGLGAARPASNPASGRRARRTKVEVFVGGKPARVIRAGPKPGCCGIDEIRFEIPHDAPRGCYVPLQVRLAGSVPSNVATLPIEPIEQNCRLVDRFRSYVREGGRAGFVIPFRLSLRIGLKPSGHADFKGDAFVAAFRDLDGSEALARRLHLPPLGCCTVYAAPVVLGDVAGAVRRELLPDMERLDAGLLEIGPPGRQRSFPPPGSDGEVYYGILGGTMPDYFGEPLPLFLTPGRVTVSSLGGPDSGPFTVPVRVPEPIVWTNRNRTRTVNRNRSLTVAWKLRDPRQLVAVAGISSDAATNTTAGFLCLADGAARRLRIPAVVLQSLPLTRSGGVRPHGFLLLATFPPDADSLFAARGLDVLLGLGVSIDGRTVRFK